MMSLIVNQIKRLLKQLPIKLQRIRVSRKIRICSPESDNNLTPVVSNLYVMPGTNSMDSYKFVNHENSL